MRAGVDVGEEGARLSVVCRDHARHHLGSELLDNGAAHLRASPAGGPLGRSLGDEARGMAHRQRAEIGCRTSWDSRLDRAIDGLDLCLRHVIEVVRRDRREIVDLGPVPAGQAEQVAVFLKGGHFGGARIGIVPEFLAPRLGPGIGLRVVVLDARLPDHLQPRGDVVDLLLGRRLIAAPWVMSPRRRCAADGAGRLTRAALLGRLPLGLACIVVDRLGQLVEVPVLALPVTDQGRRVAADPHFLGPAQGSVQSGCDRPEGVRG